MHDLLEWSRVNIGKVFTKRTMYRYVLRLNFRFYKAKKKPFISTGNKRKRLTWARGYKSWTAVKWNKVLWTDESYFRVVMGSNGTRVLRTRLEADNPACYLRRVQKPVSICVWGCMAASGVGPLHVVDGTINAERYVQILGQHLPSVRRDLFQNRPFTFQQNNARPHSARLTTAWLRGRRIKPLPWPANSPDLSP